MAFDIRNHLCRTIQISVDTLALLAAEPIDDRQRFDMLYSLGSPCIGLSVWTSEHRDRILFLSVRGTSGPNPLSTWNSSVVTHVWFISDTGVVVKSILT